MPWRKRVLKIFVGIMVLAAGATAFLVLRGDEKSEAQFIGSTASLAGAIVKGTSVPLLETVCNDVFNVDDWPESCSTSEEFSLRMFQIGDFDFYRIGDDRLHSVGFGWFDEGKKFWWAQRNGLIRTASFPDLKPIRRISFEGFRIHQIPERPELEKAEPWRIPGRKLAELDFRGAVAVGNRLVAMFGVPGYRQTTLLQLDLPSLEVKSATRLPGYFYSMLELDDDQSLVIKSDSKLAYYNVEDSKLNVFELGGHRGVRKDENGLIISIRDNESFQLQQQGPNGNAVALTSRQDDSNWHVGKQGPETSEATSVVVDAVKRIVTVRDGRELIGFASGVNLLNPRFHPRYQLGLASIGGVKSRMPGFGILALSNTKAGKVKENNQDLMPISAETIQSLLPVLETSANLPKIRSRVVDSDIAAEYQNQGIYKVADWKLDSIVDGIPAFDSRVIFDGPHIYFECVSSEEYSVTRLNVIDERVDYVIQDARLCVVTDSFLVVESQGRFLVLDKQSLQVVRDLQLNASTQFATGHSGDLFIADRFDLCSSPAVIDAETGQRLMYYTRFGSASSKQQLENEDSCWFEGKPVPDNRRLAGLTVIPVTGKKPLEISPNGTWAATRFGIVRLNWPTVTHTEIAEVSRGTANDDSDLVPQHFSRDSGFAFFPDCQLKQPKEQPKEKYVGLVRSLENPSEPVIQLVTDHVQIWMDQDPNSGNYWVRVREQANEKNDYRPVLRMIEFDSDGQLLRDLEDFCSVNQHRRFLENGELICWGDGRFLKVAIKQD